MACPHYVSLFWPYFNRLRLSHIFLVSRHVTPTCAALNQYPPDPSMRYSRMLEESSFANRSADYLWLLITSSALLLMLSPLVNMPFLSSPLAFVPIYVWSRRHPSTQISLFGLMTITAPYLPIALVGISWLLNGTYMAAIGDLLGCAVGHVVWFSRDVWPREMAGGDGLWNHAPEALYVTLPDRTR
jgi:Derlin-2/3